MEQFCNLCALSPYGTRVPPFLMASQVSVEAAADAWTRLGSFHERVCEKTDRKRAKVAGNCRNSTVTRWRSKLGVELESALTGTDPPFVFAYNPADRDMDRMKAAGFILEPVLTHVWHETSSACCAAPGGLVIDVGGNYGWFTLYSVALGCSVAVFEPVPAYQEIIRLGLRLNPGFAERVTLYGNVVTTGPPGKTCALADGACRAASGCWCGATRRQEGDAGDDGNGRRRRPGQGPAAHEGRVGARASREGGEDRRRHRRRRRTPSRCLRTQGRRGRIRGAGAADRRAAPRRPSRRDPHLRSDEVVGA